MRGTTEQNALEKHSLIVRRETRNPTSPFVLTEYQKTWLQNNYSELNNKEIISLMQIGKTTLRKFAMSLGLRKSKEGLSKIKHDAYYNLSKPKMERSGYYDKLRATGPSKKAREAASRYIKEHGNPIKMLKETNPDRYQKIVHRMSENKKEQLRILKEENPEEFNRRIKCIKDSYHKWKKDHPNEFKEYCKKQGERNRETIRKERLRVSYGLKQRTKLGYRYFVKKLTSGQVRCRTIATRNGYIAGDLDPRFNERYVIYYDSGTHRDERIEKRCERNGLEVRELTA